MAHEMEICPFCRSKPYPYLQNGILAHDGQIVFVWCDTCGAQGPEKLSDDEALAAWNTRPELPEPPPPAAPPEPVMDPRQFGFTGSMCVCGSLQMVRNGTCEKCQSCGETTGCS